MSGEKFEIILADPPWYYEQNHESVHGRITYQTMRFHELAALRVGDIAAKDCALFLWSTLPKLDEGYALLAAWGFDYVTTAFVWIKQNSANDRQHPALWFPTEKEALNIYKGIGYWTRQNAEVVLLGRRGKPRRERKDIAQVVVAPVGRHSRKPDEVRERVVQLMGDKPRVELFARERADGWQAFGNEVEGGIEIASRALTEPEVRAALSRLKCEAKHKLGDATAVSLLMCPYCVKSTINVWRWLGAGLLGADFTTDESEVRDYVEA